MPAPPAVLERQYPLIGGVDTMLREQLEELPGYQGEHNETDDAPISPGAETDPVDSDDPLEATSLIPGETPSRLTGLKKIARRLRRLNPNYAVTEAFAAVSAYRQNREPGVIAAKIAELNAAHPGIVHGIMAATSIARTISTARGLLAPAHAPGTGTELLRIAASHAANQQPKTAPAMDFATYVTQAGTPKPGIAEHLQNSIPETTQAEASKSPQDIADMANASSSGGPGHPNTAPLPDTQQADVGYEPRTGTQNATQVPDVQTGDIDTTQQPNARQDEYKVVQGDTLGGIIRADAQAQHLKLSNGMVDSMVQEAFKDPNNHPADGKAWADPNLIHPNQQINLHQVNEQLTQLQHQHDAAVANNANAPGTLAGPGNAQIHEHVTPGGKVVIDSIGQGQKTPTTSAGAKTYIVKHGDNPWNIVKDRAKTQGLNLKGPGGNKLIAALDKALYESNRSTMRHGPGAINTGQPLNMKQVDSLIAQMKAIETGQSTTNTIELPNSTDQQITIGEKLAEVEKSELAKYGLTVAPGDTTTMKELSLYLEADNPGLGDPSKTYDGTTTIDTSQLDKLLSPAALLPKPSEMDTKANPTTAEGLLIPVNQPGDNGIATLELNVDTKARMLSISPDSDQVGVDYTVAHYYDNSPPGFKLSDEAAQDISNLLVANDHSAGATPKTLANTQDNAYMASITQMLTKAQKTPGGNTPPLSFNGHTFTLHVTAGGDVSVVKTPEVSATNPPKVPTLVDLATSGTQAPTTLGSAVAGQVRDDLTGLAAVGSATAIVGAGAAVARHKRNGRRAAIDYLIGTGTHTSYISYTPRQTPLLKRGAQITQNLYYDATSPIRDAPAVLPAPARDSLRAMGIATDTITTSYPYGGRNKKWRITTDSGERYVWDGKDWAADTSIVPSRRESKTSRAQPTPMQAGLDALTGDTAQGANSPGGLSDDTRPLTSPEPDPIPQQPMITHLDVTPPEGFKFAGGDLYEDTAGNQVSFVGGEWRQVGAATADGGAEDTTGHDGSRADVQIPSAGDPISNAPILSDVASTTTEPINSATQTTNGPLSGASVEKPLPDPAGVTTPIRQGGAGNPDKNYDDNYEL